MTDCILAIDQGTTGTTALVVDQTLHVLGRKTHEFPQHFPKPGLVEHDPDELWECVLSAVRDAIALSKIRPEQIRAIGITNQRETSLIWNRETGTPLHRAIVWQDRRTAPQCAALREAGHEDRVRELTGLVLDPYFSGTKLAWTLDHVPGAREASPGELAAGTIDTYLLWRLTGGAVHATEPSNASRTMLWPLAGGGWSDEACELLRVPRSILPRVLPCNARFGVTAGVPGLPDGIAIHGIAGDQQAALFGQACFAPGEAKCTFGTGAFAMLNTGQRPVPSKSGLLTTVAWQLDDETTYALEGSAFMAGGVVQWLRDGLQIIESAPQIEQLALEVEDSGGVVFVPGHAGLGAPHWRPDARGLIRGLTRGTTRAHLARAALEGIALQVADLITAMGEDLGEPVKALRVDGGASANDTLMQIQCDLLGVKLSRPTLRESTALGAVFLAGLGVGMWSSLDDLRSAWRCDKTFSPGGDPEALARLRAAWEQAIEYA